MHMWIWWGHEFGDFMIYGLKVNTVGGLVATCFFCAGLAIFFEYLKLLQAQHRSRQLYYRTQQIRNICPPENTQLLNDREISTIEKISLPLIDIMLWIFTFNLGYLMMLTVMLYNGWIFISVILGSGLGYFIFGQKFMKINLQNCQMIRSSFCMKDCDNPDEEALRRAKKNPTFTRY
ncbi:high affinity copper uptake protein 1-like isoform X2 [Onthophagus taurus]|uniref:high affinity copper uptake protein 1-like isoform X2 n=1 Tax=Onthophagus taurus TaxID=166361 RepID=UPI0039BE7E70